MAAEHASAAQWQNDLLPHIVDRLARERPDAVYGLWPVSPASYQNGVRTTTYGQLANIVNGLAWWLVEKLGPGQQHGDIEALTYVGPNDVRLTALVLAAIKAGYVLFLTSPRNSPAAHRALFDALKCQTLVTTDPTPAPAIAVIEAVKPRQLTVPSVDELLGGNYPPYANKKTFETGRWDPLFVIHTSGSTGIPKPLIWAQETAVRHHKMTSRDPSEGVLSIDHFCRAGLAQYLFNAIPFGSVVITPAAAAGIATAQGIVDALKQTPADVAVLVPSIVAELAQNDELLDYCARHLQLILYIGGDLPQAIGDRVAAKIRLRCQWGASEVGIPQQLMPAELQGPTDWRYVRFHPCAGAAFEPVGADGVCELVIRRRDDTSTQPAFSIRGQDQADRKEYRTRDLFSRHPTVPDAWCWRARADDIIVFLNGEKTNPVSMEHHVAARNPDLLSGALVIGAQRFQAALLLDPVPTAAPKTTAEQAALIERVWPSIEEANRVAPAHARVEKSLILVATPDRPFIRAGKGTIQRNASLAQYATDIDALYANADAIQALDDDDDDDSFNTLVDAADEASIAVFIRNHVRDITGWRNTDDGDAGFFDRGMDSLQALQLTRALRRGLHRAGTDIALSTIYQNPTVKQLTDAITSMAQQKADGPAQKDRDRDMMEPLLATYRKMVDQIPVSSFSANVESNKAGNLPVDVVLTGSTGTLGTFILHSLLERQRAGVVGHIFCLNRRRTPENGRVEQDSRFTAAGLDPDALHDPKRVTFLQADLAQGPLIGIDENTFKSLQSRVGLVIHNAWPVNFNLGLAVFKPQFAGLVNLFAFATAAAAKVAFISSVGAVGGYPGPAPEAILDITTLSDAYANGYARSKLLSELLCDTAARELHIPVTILRVGQVAGSTRQASSGCSWNRNEWFPSLAISSLLKLGCLPDNLGPQFDTVDWIPSDVLGDVAVELAATTGMKGPGAEVYNLRNPNTATWKELLPVIVDIWSQREKPEMSRGDLSVISPQMWLAKLQESMDVASDMNMNPAIKLLDFYRDGLWAGAGEHEGEVQQQQQAPMAVDKALAASPALQKLQPVGQEWMRKWVEEWLMEVSLRGNGRDEC
ncbi:putative nrps-like enzyme protein [Diplogelasinospora grovesii]|uniref:Nrps-like enzyme protein n=1 Tax=Diplogelasinospora grovesii TaxID=303347 RepID=A0AAN6NB57_9PEZI|nr:putative nrps-like enzyme protein [Diplogelasinospora grovesii]